MDLGLTQKRALIVGGRPRVARACAQALLAEGAAVACESVLAGHLGDGIIPLAVCLAEAPGDLVQAAVVALGGVDIVVAVLDLPSGQDLAVEDDEGPLTAAWASLTALSALYQALAAPMRERGFGRFIWTGPVEAKQLTAGGGDIDTVVGMGALALHKVISGEMGPYGVTANSVLWDPDAAGEDALARTVGDSVAWLASEPAAYVTGFVMAVDAGRSQGLF